MRSVAPEGITQIELAPHADWAAAADEVVPPGSGRSTRGPTLPFSPQAAPVQGEAQTCEQGCLGSNRVG